MIKDILMIVAGEFRAGWMVWLWKRLLFVVRPFESFEGQLAIQGTDHSSRPRANHPQHHRPRRRSRCALCSGQCPNHSLANASWLIYPHTRQL